MQINLKKAKQKHREWEDKVLNMDDEDFYQLSFLIKDTITRKRNLKEIKHWEDLIKYTQYISD